MTPERKAIRAGAAPAPADWRALVGLGALLAACGGDGTRTAVGTVREPGAGCRESAVSYEVSSPYGDAGSLVQPPEWCGEFESQLVCFLARDNPGAFSGVQLARALPHDAVKPDDPALACWTAELQAWDRAWAQTAYHPVWDNATNGQ